MDYYDWRPYVTVAARRGQAARAVAKLEKKGHHASPVLIEGRKIAATFWGKSWCENLERYSDFANRLPRGRTYVRNGSVIDLQIAPGTVTALVSGSDIYDVRVDVAAVARTRWRTICRDCTGAIDSVVELLQGRLSSSVVTRMCEPQTGLFPAPKEISFQCSCPDWAWMCKHVAAVLYGIGARLDERPELLFLLRSVDQQDLIAKADTGLRPTKKGAAAAKVLDAGNLSEIFGIEMPEGASEPNPAARRKRAVGTRRTHVRSRRGETDSVAPAPVGASGKGPAAAAGKSIASKAAKPTAPAPSAASNTVPRLLAMTAAQRAAVSARMKAYWGERRRARQRSR